MATNQTEHYALNQWQLSDSVVMADFNADNQKVDAALAELNKRIDTAVADATQKVNAAADAAAQNLAAVQATIPHVQTGTYMGTGTSGENYPNTLTFDFKPLFLTIVTEDGNVSRTLTGTYPWLFARPWKSTHNYYNGGNYPSSIHTHVTWLDNGVSWYAQYGDGRTVTADNQLNESGVTYHYIAIG